MISPAYAKTPQRVALPSVGWYRSERMPEFALCLDKNSRHFGWLMQEGWNDNWVSLRPLTRADLLKLQEQPNLMRDHAEAVAALFSKVPA